MADGKTLFRCFIQTVKPVLVYAARVVLCLLLLWTIHAFESGVGEAQDDSAEILQAGAVIAASLSGGETKTYLVTAQAAQHVRLEISKADLALKVSACLQSGNSCFEFTRRSYGKLDISFTTPVPGKYALLVKSLESDSVSRSIDLRLFEIVYASSRHQSIDAATAVEADAETLKERSDLSSRLAAVSEYGEARKFWESAGEYGKAAEVLCDAGDVYFSLSKYREALSQYEESLAINKGSDQLARLTALNGIAYMQANLGQNDTALENAQSILKEIEKLTAERTLPPFKRIEAQATNTIGEVYHARRELQKAIEYYSKTEPIWREARDRAGEALALLNLGYAYADMSDLRRASEHYQRALSLFDKIHDGRGRALAQTANAGVLSILGEPQAALDLHQKALGYFHQTGYKQGEAAALNGVAGAYEDLSEYQAAIDNYIIALRLFEEIGNQRYVALTKFAMGRAMYRQGDRDNAEKYCLESLEQSRKARDPVVEAHTLQSLATISFEKGDTRRALEQVGSALKIYTASKNWWSEAYALNDLGHFQAATGNLKPAMDNYQRALQLMKDAGDLRGKALTLVNLGKLEWQRANLTTALSLVEDSLKITESLHGKIRNTFLRTSFFTSVQQQYEVYVDMLMRLHREFPQQGYDKQALVANERSRARSLIDSLVKYRVRTDNRQSSDLVSRELELLQALNDKADQQMRLSERQHTQAEAEELSQQIRLLTIEYQDVQSKLRGQNSRQWSLTQPAELRAEELRGIVNDDETLLLEIFMGEKQSYLWLISPRKIASYELPGRETIESSAHKVSELAIVRQSMLQESNTIDAEKVKEADAEYWRQAQLLSNMLIGPVATELGSKRLLIVADGFLQYISFDALPTPNRSTTAEAEPLFLGHEVISIPSALALAALRRPPAFSSDASRKLIAILADPVFERDDPRVAANRQSNPQPAHEVYLSMALRSVNEGANPDKISRLPSTLREANAIMNVTPTGECVLTTGFLATKDQVMAGGLKDYRIIHFATHGLLNGEHPELSGIILSLLDEHGNSTNGFLRINDIYSLNLPADLIVLSACRTGLGKTVRGEGVIGLPSAFMYAGAKSVIASLWKVEDEATAELMSHFYTALFREGLHPAAALRKAKIEMWKQQRWRAPFYWGAFVFQGDYTGEIVAPPRRTLPKSLIIGGVLTLGVAATYILIRLRRQRLRS